MLQRTTTLEEPADNDEEYDSDFGEDEFEDEQGNDIPQWKVKYGLVCTIL